MKEQIILLEIPVRLAGGYTHFEIRIPNSVNLIKAVSTGINIKNLNIPPAFAGNSFMLQRFPIGIVRLQGGRPVNWFYDGIVKENIFPVVTEGFYTKSDEMILPFSFHAKHNKELLHSIPAQTRITGFYKDNIGKLFAQDIVYTIILTLTINQA